MGNLCGKPSKEDNFAGPGRVLGSAPAPSNNARASVPPKIAANNSPKPQTQGRTVGGAPDGTGEDPKSAAARAAEARAQKASAAAGELAKKLEAQKKQTRAQTLEQASYENRAARDADAALEARNYN